MVTPGRGGLRAQYTAGRVPTTGAIATTGACVTIDVMTGTTNFSTVGVVAETKTSEGRVALTPDGVRELSTRGARVLIETGAGVKAGITDEDYRAAGGHIVGCEDAWGAALVVKVKEPQEHEFLYLREDLTLFTYLHLAAYPQVAEALCMSKTTAYAYETVTDPRGGLPLLAPMSEIAGRLAPQMGAHCLTSGAGGSGVLLAGSAGVSPGNVTVIGAGNVGWNAARIAAGMGANVTLLDTNLERLRALDNYGIGRIRTLAANRGTVERSVRDADMLIGAVLVPGDRAPVVVDAAMVASMRPGSVIVDVAVDQGGCIATTRETTHTSPTYIEQGVVHYAVGNMPGAVPRTSTYALTNATLPYIADLATLGNDGVFERSHVLRTGLQTRDGRPARTLTD